MSKIPISAGHDFSLGLKSDGTVVAIGDNKKGQCDVSEWTHIVGISTGKDVLYPFSLGLKTDGTIETTIENSKKFNVSSWSDIAAISVGSDHVLGLKTDGTIVAVGNNEYGQCNVSGWTDIKVLKK